MDNYKRVKVVGLVDDGIPQSISNDGKRATVLSPMLIRHPFGDIEIDAGYQHDGFSTPFDNLITSRWDEWGLAALAHDRMYFCGYVTMNGKQLRISKHFADAVMMDIMKWAIWQAGYPWYTRWRKQIKARLIYVAVILFGGFAWNKHRKKD